MGNYQSSFKVFATEKISDVFCKDKYKDHLNNLNNDINKLKKILDDLTNERKKIDDQIDNKKTDIHAARTRRRLLEQRIAQMKEALRLGIIRLMRERRVNVTIPNEDTETYAYLSYNRSYVIEI